VNSKIFRSLKKGSIISSGIYSENGNFGFGKSRPASWHLSGTSLRMSTTSSPTSASTDSTVLRRVKAIDATESTDGNPVLIKGWVRTVRKQKTLAFVEVNDGSNMNGIQCVLSFDSIDDDTQKGMVTIISILSLLVIVLEGHRACSHERKIDFEICRDPNTKNQY
jgi:hypothetical protein